MRLPTLAPALLLSLALSVDPPSTEAQAPPGEEAPSPRVLLIGIDGVRPDILEEVATPHLDELIRHGAYTPRAQTGLPTVSGPSWSSMLTGVWKEKHGVEDNEFTRSRFRRYPDFLTRIEALRPELETFAVATWLPLVADDEGKGPVISDAVDRRHALNGYDLGWARADDQGVELTLRELRTGDPDALFVYLGNPDEVSHHTGSIEYEYPAAIRRADAQVGALIEALRSRSGYPDQEEWLVLVSTDHGRTEAGSHGGASPEERTIFLIAWGAGVSPDALEGNVEIVDVAATALAHLGLGPDAAWELDGRALVDEPEAASRPEP